MLQVVLFHVITDKNEIIAVIDATFAEAKRKLEEFRLAGIRSLDFYNTVAALYRLS